MKALRRRDRHAFTLVELLAVVTILLILAVLLVPAFVRSRERAIQLRCMANVREVTRAILASSGRGLTRPLPEPTDFGSLGGKTGSQPALGGLTPAEERPLFRRLSDPSVFQCPADRGDAVLGVRSVFDAVGSSYLYPVRTTDGIQAIAGSNVTAFAFPARKIILFEPPMFADRDLARPESHWHGRQRRTVAGYLDGHVELQDSAGYLEASSDHLYY